MRVLCCPVALRASPRPCSGPGEERAPEGRQRQALHTLPSRFKKKGFVFVNPKRKTRWVDIKKRFGRAVDAAELHGL